MAAIVIDVSVVLCASMVSLVEMIVSYYSMCPCMHALNCRVSSVFTTKLPWAP